MKPSHLAALALCTLAACSVDETGVEIPLPAHIPAIHWPENDVPTQSVVDLGERLFFSPILSLDQTISCASCHLPSHGFADVNPVSEGIHGQFGFRNTPSVYNVAWKANFFLEGGVDRIERATLGPMLTEEEMFLQAPELLERLRRDASWNTQFVAAFGEDYEYKSVIDALSAYQRSLVSVDSKWDDFQAGHYNLTSSEMRGMLLFESDSLACASCHVAPFFRDDDFHDIGLPVADEADYGRGRFTFDSTDYYSFSTPSIRNVELTSPYMHDGSIPTLDSVIRFYEAGGVRTSEIAPFHLSSEDRDALISFLLTLTGEKARKLTQQN